MKSSQNSNTCKEANKHMAIGAHFNNALTLQLKQL